MTYDLICADGHVQRGMHGTQGKTGNIPVTPPCPELLDNGEPCGLPTEVVNLH